MNSKQRVLCSLDHKTPDILPFDLGATIVSGIHIDCLKRYLKHINYQCSSEIEVVERLGVSRLSSEIMKLFQVDVFGVCPIEGPKKREMDEKYQYYYDEWGIKWCQPLHNGKYYDVCFPTFTKEDVTIADLDKFEWPDGSADFRFDVMDEQISMHEKDYAILVEGILGGEILDGSFWMRGYENLFCDLLLNEEMVEHLFEIKLRIQCQYWKKIAQLFDGRVDIVRIGDDLGEQTTTRISPKLYRKLIKPKHKALIDYIHSVFKHPVRILFHSDGCIYDLIPDLIEIGVDAINPVQYTLKNMNPQKLKNEFGKHVSFWGGAIDTQKILPFGNASEIKDEVKREIEILGKDGGMVISAVHNIQHDVSVENFSAFLDAVKSYRFYI